MKYCPKCGSLIENGANVCTECGAPVNEPVQQTQQPVYQQPVYNNAYQQPDPMSKDIETGNTLGIIALVCSLIGPLLLTVAGLVVGIVGMGKIKPYKNGHIFPNDKAKSAYNLNKAGMIISIVKLSLIVLTFIGLMIMIFVVGIAVDPHSIF